MQNIRSIKFENYIMEIIYLSLLKTKEVHLINRDM